MDIRVELLADHAQLVPVITLWLFDEWGHHDPSSSQEQWRAGVGHRTTRDEVPTAYVAFADGEPAGTASLVEHDMKTRMDLSPWLADVFVLPRYRHKGIASDLVRAVVAAAARIGVPVLYLFTADARDLYAGLGWQDFGREQYEGREVVIMRIEPGAG